MKVTIALLTAMICGCAQIAGTTPSLQYCQKVSYNRDGSKMHIEADCQAPIGGSIIGP